MTLDVNKLFKTLEEGGSMGSTMPDRQRIMRQRIQKKIEDIDGELKDKADALRKRASDYNERKTNISINGKDYTDPEDLMIQMLKVFMRLAKWLVIGVVIIGSLLIFKSFLVNENAKIPPLNPPAIEDTVKPDTLKKL